MYHPQGAHLRSANAACMMQCAAVRLKKLLRCPSHMCMRMCTGLDMQQWPQLETFLSQAGSDIVMQASSIMCFESNGILRAVVALTALSS